MNRITFTRYFKILTLEYAITIKKNGTITIRIEKERVSVNKFLSSYIVSFREMNTIYG